MHAFNSYERGPRNARRNSRIGTFAVAGHFKIAPDCADAECAVLDVDWLMLSVCNTSVVTGCTGPLLRASLLWNAYPAFARAYAPNDAATARTLAPFVHCNALFSGETAIKRRLTSLKTTAKRKPNETLPRCGIWIG